MVELWPGGSGVLAEPLSMGTSHTGLCALLLAGWCAVYEAGGRIEDPALLREFRWVRRPCTPLCASRPLSPHKALSSCCHSEAQPSCTAHAPHPSAQAKGRASQLLARVPHVPCAPHREGVRRNFGLLHGAAARLGGVPPMLGPDDWEDGGPDARCVRLFLAHLAHRLLGLSREQRAAHVITRALRARLWERTCGGWGRGKGWGGWGGERAAHVIMRALRAWLWERTCGGCGTGKGWGTGRGGG